MTIISVHGKARSGKDSLCDILVRSFGACKVSFAEEVKRLGVKYFQLTDLEISDKKTKDSRRILQGIGNSARNLKLQHIPEPEEGPSGYPTWVEKIAIDHFDIDPADLKRKRKYIRSVLEGVRQMYTMELTTFLENGWPSPNDVWINLLWNKLTDPSMVYVISDMRYQNEKEKVELSGGKCVKVVRPVKPKIEAGENHPSEVELDSDTRWDAIVMNEAVADWEARMLVDASNIMRKFSAEGLFSEEQVKRFNVNLDE